ncbi:MAG: DUF429 domain-containing protein [Thermoplasmata archaeon]
MVGLDLAGSPRRTTGFCCLGRGLRAETQALHTDEEIRAAIRVAKPDVVAIDAPLFLPLGRSTIEDRSGPHLRGCDRELLRLGIRFFPVTLGPMRMLTSRGMRLRAELADAGIRAIECYPGAAQDLWGIPRKQAGNAALRRGLETLGVGGDLRRPDLTHDELDAVTCALVGRDFLRGDFLAIGRTEEGVMVLPSQVACRRRYRARGVRPSDGPPPPHGP